MGYSKAALQWYIDHGVDEVLADAPVDRTISVVPDAVEPKQLGIKAQVASNQPETNITGTAESITQAREIAAKCNDLDELRDAIDAFEGLSVKKTATNMVFADGNAKSKIMLIGEAPGADEDRQGKPFVGLSGQLLDRVIASIGLSRQNEEPFDSVYISNILNWRPPGNRTPSQSEIEISMPFISRHIELIAPQIIVLLGGVSGKAILDRNESISKLRGSFHNLNDIQVMATYHPAYLLRTPMQKKAVWQDMLMLKEKIDRLKNT